MRGPALRQLNDASLSLEPCISLEVAYQTGRPCGTLAAKFSAPSAVDNNIHTNMSNLADRFTQLEATLALAAVELSPSEVHGTIVGAIANHLKSGITPDLLKLIEPHSDADAGRFARLTELLQSLYRETGDVLLSGSEGFELMLPDDDEPLPERVEGLASWSRGYLLGLLYNNAFSIDQLPENGSEIVRDIMQIAEAGAGADEEREEDWALAELHEYIKVGAQLVFEFIYSERASDAPELEQ